MCRKTFYRKLREFAPRFLWKLEDGAIRASSKNNRLKDCCPLAFVDFCVNGNSRSSSFFEQSAEDLGVSQDDAELIANAADFSYEYCDNKTKPIRRALLNAVGLQEQQ